MGKALFKYVPVKRLEGGKELWFCEESQGRFEMAPWFECYTTAAEICLKASRGDDHVNGIPCCPVRTPVPRPPGTVFVPSEKVTAPPQPRRRVR